MTWLSASVLFMHDRGPSAGKAEISASAPGLAIHRGRGKRIGTPKGWTITQVETGRAVLREIPTRSKAAAAAIALAKGADWHGSLERMKARQDGPALKDLAEAVAAKYGGHHRKARVLRFNHKNADSGKAWGGKKKEKPI